MTKMFVWFFILINLLLFVGVPIVGFNLYNEPPPLLFTRRVVLTKQVPPGGTLKIEVSSDVSNRCGATIFRRIVDGKGISFNVGAATIANRTNYITEIPVPLGAASGESYYSANILWRCNIVQNWFPQEIQQRNLPFKIIPFNGQSVEPEQQGIYQEPFIEKDDIK